jgi:hypothetical protein
MSAPLQAGQYWNGFRNPYPRYYRAAFASSAFSPHTFMGRPYGLLASCEAKACGYYVPHV